MLDEESDGEGEAEDVGRGTIVKPFVRTGGAGVASGLGVLVLLLEDTKDEDEVADALNEPDRVGPTVAEVDVLSIDSEESSSSFTLSESSRMEMDVSLARVLDAEE